MVFGLVRPDSHLAKRLVAMINTAGGAGFRDLHGGQKRQGWLQAIPDPHSHVFAGGILQTVNFVEIMVIQLLPKRLERCGDIGVIDHPAKFGIALALDHDLRLKTVPVQPAAFVILREVWQVMRCLELKCLA